ncbi:MAG: RT0821/Lpp0805 family surface protein [Alphaproteobacteria bacterium]
MRNVLVLLCCGLAGCSAIDNGFEQVKQAATGVAERIDAAFADPTEMYGQMSDGDVDLAAAAMRVALETKATAQSVAWTNDMTGNEGSITPRRTFITDLGVFCRDYDERLTIGGRDGVIQNTACRGDEGAWTWAS